MATDAGGYPYGGYGAYPYVGCTYGAWTYGAIMGIICPYGAIGTAWLGVHLMVVIICSILWNQ